MAGISVNCAVSHFVCISTSNQDNSFTLASIARASSQNIVISKMVDNFENKSNINLEDRKNSKTPKNEKGKIIFN